MILVTSKLDWIKRNSLYLSSRKINFLFLTYLATIMYLVYYWIYTLQCVKFKKKINVICSVFCTNQTQRWQIVGTPIVLQLEIIPIHTLFCISSLVVDTVTYLDVLLKLVPLDEMSDNQSHLKTNNLFSLHVSCRL